MAHMSKEVLCSISPAPPGPFNFLPSIASRVVLIKPTLKQGYERGVKRLWVPLLKLSKGIRSSHQKNKAKGNLHVFR